MNKFMKPLLLLLFPLISCISVFSQVTTGTLTGTAKSEKGEVLSGASVTAVHEPTGSKYQTIAGKEGQYTLPNLKVGGPYKITIHYTGYSDAVLNDVNITLGTPVVINTTLTPGTETMTGVTVVGTGKGSVISSQRNGTSTYLSSRIIQAVPSVNRNIQDYARLMPQAKSGSTASNGNGVGVSFGGQNNRYNQFSIDGANASDAFGLSSSGTNGAQANINPISMEAIQEMQIVLSPYDVTQGGFTGGGINAVTKSGTNTFHGAVYGQFQPNGLIGKSVSYNDGITRNPIYGDYKNQTYGASLGGAIIKNKLFFYVNAEHFEKSTALANDPTIAGSGSKVDTGALRSLRNFLISQYNYDPGSYGAINIQNQSTSVFGRLDWNINDKNKLVFRFNHVEGYLDNLSRSATSAAFANSGYRFSDVTNSAVLELNTNFSSRSSNVLRFTYSAINDSRSTSAFPNLVINNYNSVSGATITYNMGSEFSSAVNGLNQKVFTVTDNFTLYRDKHTLTFGTNDEFFNSSNLFLQGFYGAYTYGTSGNTNTNNITNFMGNTGLTSYSVGFSNSPDSNDKGAANLHAAQFSVYGQDVWQANSKLKITYGLRIDLPVFFNQPDSNTNFNNAFAAYGVSTNQMPSGTLLFSPRAGFNWDVKGNATTQIRGGAGLFTGRVPFVWISNDFSMTGVKTSAYSASNATAVTAAGIAFPANAAGISGPHLGGYIPTAGNATPVINVVDQNFKFPQVFRTNLAIDQKLNWWGLIGTAEVVFTKTINNANYTNINISPEGDSYVNIGGMLRPYWSKYQNTSYQQVLKLSNTSKGYAYTFTGQIQKPSSHGWSGSIAYTYGHSTSLNDLTSSVALSNWRSPLTVNGLNNPRISTSNFNLGSRIVGYVTKEFKYAKHYSTSLTLIYTGQTGQGLSYVYGNNILGDNGIGSATGATALAYLPQTAAEANFVDIKNGATAAQQWINYQGFVSSNQYLNDHIGKVTERNGDNMPFESHFDFRVTQEFMMKNHKLQLYFDILNISNLLNSNWGWSYSGISSTADGFFTASSSLFSVVTSGAQTVNGTAVAAPTATSPALQFNINNFNKINGVYRPYQVSDFTSRWSGQIGLRYSF